MTEGIYNVAKQDKKAKRKDRIVFPDLDRILALAYPDAKKFISQITEAAWITNYAFKCNYGNTYAKM